jgi:hypothetical protein
MTPKVQPIYGKREVYRTPCVTPTYVAKGGKHGIHHHS